MKKLLVILGAVLTASIITGAFAAIIWCLTDLTLGKAAIAGFVIFLFVVLALDYVWMACSFYRMQKEWKRWQ